MWIACAAGGVWQSTNFGRSWSPVDNPLLSNVPVMTLVLDPADPNTLYAGTGQDDFSLEPSQAAGIFKSTDRGATWSQLPASVSVELSYINRLAFSTDGKSLFAGTRTGLFRSTDKGVSFQAALAAANVEILDVEFHPTDRQMCLAGGGRTYSSPPMAV